LNRAFVSAAILAGANAQSAPDDQPRVAAAALARADTGALLGALPPRFVPNLGQWPSGELYRVRAGALALFGERAGWAFWLSEPDATAVPPGARPGRAAARPTAGRCLALRMTFAGAQDAPVEPEGLLSGTTNYIGAGGADHAGVPGYAAVVYRSLYPGIDVRLHHGAQGLEYDVLLAPGAELRPVEVEVEGASALRVEASGCLVLTTELGEVRQPRPMTWMVRSDGGRSPVACDYVLRSPTRFGFEVHGRDPEMPLVVDPPLVYSTFLGGSLDDWPSSIVEDGNGKIIVGGETPSLDFPVRTGSLQTVHAGAADGFIVRIDPTQPPANQFEFATYLGGSGDDRVTAVAALPGGLVGIAGATTSLDLPVTAGAFQTAYAGNTDTFVGTLDARGSALVGLTYLGGTGHDSVWGMALDPGLELVVAGITTSTAFPTTANAYDRVHHGGNDAFVARLSADGTSLSYSTYLGTSGDEGLLAAAVSASGVVTLIGGTNSPAFPVTANAFDPTFSGGIGPWWGQEGTIVQLDPSKPPAQQLDYSTFLGGSGEDVLWFAEVAANGDIVVSGTTTSNDFPTTADAYSRTNSGGAFFNNDYVAGDAVVARLDPRASGQAGLVASTYLGGIDQEQGLGCALDSSGVVTIVGWTRAGSTMPTTPDAMRRAYVLNEGWMARVSRDGRQLLYGSLFGGSSHDGAWLAARHADGTASIMGGTVSFDFPTRNPAQATHGGTPGNQDGFVARLALVPAGTTRYGESSRNPSGWPTIHALDDAVLGNANFGLACSRANVNRQGVLLLGAGSLPAVPVLGIRLHVDVGGVYVALPVTSDLRGESSIRFPYPASAFGSLYAQYLWVEGAAPLTLSASDALRLN